MKVEELGLDGRIAAILAAQGITELYPPQVESMGPALEGKNLVLAIPTASGKSLVAYLAILNSVLKGGKALYIVPLRALAREKYEDLRPFEALGLRVALAMGDYDTDDPTLQRYDIIVATSEKADSLLRHRSHWLGQLTVVVADEVHLINDPGRGPTLEVTLAKLRQVNPRAQVIALSATIANSHEIAEWLGAVHIRSEWRPVPLRSGVCVSGRILWTDQTTKYLLDPGDDLEALVKDSLREGGQCLIFVNTRQSTETLARKLLRCVSPFLPTEEVQALAAIAEEQAERQEEPTSFGARLSRCLRGGTAFHHAGLTNEQRRIVEENFKRGRVKVIVATPTLCLHPDTPITTPRGAVRISELEEGDEVLTHRGRFRRVVGTTSRWFDGDLLQVEAEGMLPVRMTAEHRVLRRARSPSGPRRNPITRSGVGWLEGEWVLARDLRPGDEVLAPLGGPGLGADGGVALPRPRGEEPGGEPLGSPLALAQGGVAPGEFEGGGRGRRGRALGAPPWWSPIRRIATFPYSGEVFNLHVEGDESYVCSSAFAVHNSAGINLPARRVIIRDTRRYDANYGYSPISVIEIKQMCGRAGRPRYDTHGEAILMARHEEDAEFLREAYLDAEPEAVESKLGTEPALRVHILAAIATEHVRTEEELHRFLARTFYAHQGDVEDIEGRIRNVLAFLEAEGFIRRGEFLGPTLFGRRTSDLYIDPLSAVALRRALTAGVRASTFGYLHALCATPDMPKLYLRRGDYEWVEAKLNAEELLVRGEEYDFLLAEVKTASLLEAWAEEASEDDIVRRFNVGPGDIRRMVDNAQWLLYSMHELARIFNREHMGPLALLMPRVRYGIKEDALDLINLRGIGRVRARILLERGIRTREDLRGVTADWLARLPSFGPALAQSLLGQLGMGRAKPPAEERPRREGQFAIHDFE